MGFDPPLEKVKFVIHCTTGYNRPFIFNLWC